MELMNSTSNQSNPSNQSNQLFVFPNHRSRVETATMIKTTFQLTEHGLALIDTLVDKCYDRELVGHLLAFLSNSNSNLQKEVASLKAEMLSLFVKHRELEQESKQLAKKNAILTESQGYYSLFTKEQMKRQIELENVALEF